MKMECAQFKLELPLPVHLALSELKKGLTDLYGERLRGLYLYGSYARGEARPDSDVDILVVLAGEVRTGTEIHRMNEVVAEVGLDDGLLIAKVPISERRFLQEGNPFLLNVREEAIPI